MMSISCRLRVLKNVILLVQLLAASIATAQVANEANKELPSEVQLLNMLPFEQHAITDSLGRTITYYLSREQLSQAKSASETASIPLPLVVFINGSGAQSVFARYQDKVSSGLQGLVLRLVKGRARVMVVEKQGVKFVESIEQPGSAIGASQEFLNEHTLDRWTTAHVAAIEACWKLPNIDASRTLVMGHSEGSSVAASVARRVPSVTHVACLSGGGATQLLSLSQLALRPQPGDKPGDALKRRQAIYDGWAEVLKDPDSTSKFWLGHPNRRWSTFLPHNSAEDLLQTQAQIYLVQGLNDTAEDPASHEYTAATLRAHGKILREELLEGADHGFRTQEIPEGSPDGFTAVFSRVTLWFLGR